MYFVHCVYTLLSITSDFMLSFAFFFHDTSTTEIYTLSLHDALPICGMNPKDVLKLAKEKGAKIVDLRFIDLPGLWQHFSIPRSEEHTSELQSRLHLVCRLLLEKKKHN